MDYNKKEEKDFGFLNFFDLLAILGICATCLIIFNSCD